MGKALIPRPLGGRHSLSIGFAVVVVIGCTRGAIFVFVIARDAERAAQFFGQRRLAEQAGVRAGRGRLR
jgi:hypothetical protein